MKKIICYGDSNTFGFNPKDGSRLDENTLWTFLLQKSLGKEYEVINEGMCDRTGFVDNPKGLLYSGSKHFPKFIAKTENVDLIILWIGTNDLQFQYNINLDTVESGLRNLIKSAKEKTENIIIIPPVILNESILKGYFKCQFDETSIVKSKEFGKMFEYIANENNCKFIDMNQFTKPSDFDGLHYDKNSHKIIAEKLNDFIKKWLFI